MRISTKLLGDAGEHYVAFKLARMGINPALLSTNSKGVDILATDDGNKVISIQVKTSAARNSQSVWHVGKHKPTANDHYFYVFVNLRDEPQEITCFIVPSKKILKDANWNATQPTFSLKKDERNIYQDNWNSIRDLF